MKITVEHPDFYSLNDFDGEVWKDIPNYEGYYQVSNYGRVKSLKRRRKNKVGYATIKERQLKQFKNEHTGYWGVVFCVDNSKKSYRTHQLVAMGFLGHKPNGFEFVVDHIDNDKNNNKLSNIQITTNRHNSTKDKFGGTSENPCVYRRNGRFCVGINFNRKAFHIGTFKTELKAKMAYDYMLDKIKNGTFLLHVNHFKDKSTSKYVGVCWNKEKKKWRSSISIDGKNKHLGYFDEEHDAFSAYKKYYEKHHNKKLKNTKGRCAF